PILTPPPPEPPKPPKLSGEPLRLLNVLQRDGRLLDFLLEDISAATDEQVGAGVRELHKKAQAAIKEHLTLGPILPGRAAAAGEVRPGGGGGDGQGGGHPAVRGRAQAPRLAGALVQAAGPAAGRGRAGRRPGRGRAALSPAPCCRVAATRMQRHVHLLTLI